jgi:hypothetical protein
MAMIGRKVINSNINIEDEFKRRIGQSQASSPTPKASD